MSDLVSEDHILARIASHFPNEGPDVLLGRGDDCAVLGVSGPLCVSTDLFMEDVHFRRSYFTPEDIGWKALAVNLSDLAADGARPMGFTVGLSLPPDADMALVDGLCAGMAELAAQASVPLVGGDLSRADKLHLCLTVFGQAEKTLLRGEAQPGDVIFLIGRTGLARAGLLLLEERGRAALNGWPIPCEAHLRPAPRLKEGMRLSRLAADWGREKGDPTCGRLGLMDLSDGLARDLPRLIGPGMGADIGMPMPHTEILRFMRSRNEAEPVAAARRHAFLGGEDYALIGTCSPELAVHVMVANAETTMLGKVTEGGEIRVDGIPVSGGFGSFRGLGQVALRELGGGKNFSEEKLSLLPQTPSLPFKDFRVYQIPVRSIP